MENDRDNSRSRGYDVAGSNRGEMWSVWIVSLRFTLPRLPRHLFAFAGYMSRGCLLCCIEVSYTLFCGEDGHTAGGGDGSGLKSQAQSALTVAEIPVSGQVWASPLRALLAVPDHSGCGVKSVARPQRQRGSHVCWMIDDPPHEQTWKGYMEKIVTSVVSRCFNALRFISGDGSSDVVN